MTTKTVVRATFSGTLALASLASAQDVQFFQSNKEIAEANGTQFVYQFSNGANGLQSKLVTGAPYQADEKTVMTQTLSDGNRIVQTTAAKVYRDQQGRTRVERSLKGLTLPEGGDLGKTTTINDPSTGAHYVLDERKRTAMKGPYVTMQDSKSGPDGAHMVEMEIKKAAEAKASLGPPAIVTTRRIDSGAKNTKTEDLGTQVMEGLSVQGTRTTVTIAAGQMFNERPIEIVSERWFSPDLQIVIMSKRNDPRMGETVYTVSNINRANPDASLFQIPAGYSEVQSSSHEGMKHVIVREE